MQTFQTLLILIGQLAVIITLIMAFVTFITLIIGLVKKDYKHFKRSLKILLWPVGLFLLIILLYALDRAISQ